jgi:UDP-glucuronate decarboxylase
MEVDSRPDGPVNLGNPAEFKIRELAELVLEMTGSRSPLRFLPLPVDDPKRRRPDIGRAGKFLRWRPTTSLRSGLALTIQHFLITDMEVGIQPADMRPINYPRLSRLALLNSQ